MGKRTSGLTDRQRAVRIIAEMMALMAVMLFDLALVIIIADNDLIGRTVAGLLSIVLIVRAVVLLREALKLGARET